jgi:hypothetical protein
MGGSRDRCAPGVFVFKTTLNRTLRPGFRSEFFGASGWICHFAYCVSRIAYRQLGKMTAVIRPGNAALISLFEDQSSRDPEPRL